MEYLKSKNPYFAMSKMDRFCVRFFVFGVHLGFWYEVFHVLPHYQIEDSSTVNRHRLMAAIFYVSVLSNLYKVIVTRNDCRLSVIGSNETREWPFCDRCCIYKPPRSHHCKRCNTCIILRDHHCWFAGCCIGYSNYRYYLSLLMYMFAAMLYANIFHFRFVMDCLGHLKEFLPICLVAPHLAVMMGLLTRYQFMVTLLTSFSMFCVGMLGWLLLVQAYQMIRGQTQYERKKKITNYNVGILSNLQTVMGRYWYVAWISPWIPSPSPGDGVTFPERVKAK